MTPGMMKAMERLQICKYKGHCSHPPNSECTGFCSWATVFEIGAEYGVKQRAQECVDLAHELIYSIWRPDAPENMTRKEVVQLVRSLMEKMEHPGRPWGHTQGESGAK